jgi:hypothetical protein
VYGDLLLVEHRMMKAEEEVPDEAEEEVPEARGAGTAATPC